MRKERIDRGLEVISDYMDKDLMRIGDARKILKAMKETHQDKIDEMEAHDKSMLNLMKGPEPEWHNYPDCQCSRCKEPEEKKGGVKCRLCGGTLTETHTCLPEEGRSHQIKKVYEEYVGYFGDNKITIDSDILREMAFKFWQAIEFWNLERP